MGDKQIVTQVLVTYFVYLELDFPNLQLLHKTSVTEV